jgi:DNA-directed RNA polymerase subunit RPC12/RpoP
VILPELVRNYGDMPIQCHDCENSFFLPTDQLSKTSGGVVRHRCGSCKLALYLPKMKQISAPLRFVCPNCTSPLPTRPWRRLPGWRGIVLAIVIGLFIGAAGFQLEPASLATLKVGLVKTQIMAIDIFNGIQSWVRTLYTAL